jgi:hypothetical protein
VGFGMSLIFRGLVTHADRGAFAPRCARPSA